MQICPPKLIFIIQNNFQNNFESQILTVFMQNIPVIMSIHTFPLSMYIFCRIQLRFFSSFGSFVIEFAKSLIWCRIAAHITLGQLIRFITYHPIFRRKKLIHLTRLPYQRTKRLTCRFSSATKITAQCSVLGVCDFSEHIHFQVNQECELLF